MASVKSLGLHQPAGLQQAIDEQLLPADPKPSSYAWSVITDKTVGPQTEDELLTTKDSVIWCRGGIFRKTYRFDLEKEPVNQALLAYFPTSQDDRKDQSRPINDDTVASSGLEKALVVFLKTQAHIYFLSGTNHVVHMPFEVESAFAGPFGVIIQRRQKTESVAPVSLRFPRVPPNSFVSSQPTAVDSFQQSAFSTEGLGNPRSLYLGTSLTMENMWEAPLERTESHWPRLVSLVDPLQDIGLVVVGGDAHAARVPRNPALKKPAFLDSAEEMLHLEQVQICGMATQKSHDPVVLAVTMNRVASNYTIWRVTYMNHDDPFIGRHKSSKTKASRRRSSMPPAYTNGASTPVPPNFRESLGATLPGKRTRKSEKIEKPIDLVSSLEQHDPQGPSALRRSSRRVSSMLARADLSASQERAAFSEQTDASGPAVSRRHESLGSQHARMSSNYNAIHPSLGSLLEAPLEFGLNEGLDNMGLDDHDFDGLQHDVLFTRIHSEPMNSSNVRYSTSGQPAQNKSRVFFVAAPQFATEEYQRSQLLVGIQDPIEKRLQLLTLHVKLQQKLDATPKIGSREPEGETTVSISPGEVRNAQNVVDSCELVDGDQSAVLVLSESMTGFHELSTQAPWSEMSKISLSYLVADHTRSLQYRGRAIDRDVRQKKIELFDLSLGSIVGIRHPRGRGTVDIVDAEGRLHQLRIRLQPINPQVSRVLGVCKSILSDSAGHRMHAGWLHAMQWLQSEAESVLDNEWSAMAIVLFATFLNLGQVEPAGLPSTRLTIRKRRPPSGSFGSIRDSDDWRALEVGETKHSLGYPAWMMSGGWQWALDDGAQETLTSHGDQNASDSFTPKHVALTKEFMNSSLGEAAFGPAGYMPTALAKGTERRQKMAVDIFMGLYLLLEEEKLDVMTPEHTSSGRADLRVLLCQVARWLRWHNFAEVLNLGIQEDLDNQHNAELRLKPPIPEPLVRPNVFEWIQSRLAGARGTYYLTLADIYYAGSCLPEADKRLDRRWDTLIPRTLMFKQFFKLIRAESTAVQMVEAIKDCGMKKHVLETLPEAILVPLQDAISLCQPHPPSQWSKDLLELVKRSDISYILESAKQPNRSMSSLLAPTHNATWDFKLLCQSVEETNNVGYDEGDGTERQAVIRALFKDDRRLNEAQDLLSTHKARVIKLVPNPSWPESEYLEKQKELVTRIANSTLAIPGGRGMLYYSLRYPLITQKFHIGGFNLNCIVRPTNVTVGVDKSLFSEEKVCWGFFHQGVAAGLAISPQAKGIDTSWILYNKPGDDLSNRHAGFLLALGLNGHLKGVAKWVAFKYLTPKHTMTSIGLLLGLAASYRGTMDSLITRLLSVHATRMLPRGAAELNLPHLTQTSGIMGIGLLYCNSQHRRMSEIMISEIEHIDEEDEEEPLRSECYRLTAGFSLGLINLGKGNDLKGLHDMRLTDKLIAHATATKNVEIVHMLDRAAAGATMAIALIFMKTEDQIVARKIDIPDSILEFDYIRPDILLLRTLAKNIILWSKIEPTFSWIQKSLPTAYQPRHKLQRVTKLKSTDLPFFSILAGLCFSVSLRFSGSASPKIRDLLLHYLDQFMRIATIPSTKKEHPDADPPYDEELARSQARTCQDVLALSVAVVMAGTGDIAVLRRLRALHGRDDPDTPYGSHLAAHLAIGALFLGCGTATFGSSNMAIAALLVAFYPVFPTNVMDNRSHLQAFRHFWVLATEQRCLVAKDVITGQPVSVSIHIKMQHNSSGETVLHRTTPCLLPPLDQVASLSTDCGPQYWDVELDFRDERVRKAFGETQSLYLRRRPPRGGVFTSTLGALGADGKGDEPLAWIFGLKGLEGVSYVERAAILDGGEGEEEVSSAVDAKLEMERGILGGGDRERLEGARLLFEWGGARHRLLKRDNPSDSQETETTPSQQEKDETVADAVWWMKDGAIEALKGKVWLAGREGES